MTNSKAEAGRAGMELWTPEQYRIEYTKLVERYNTLIATPQMATLLDDGARPVSASPSPSAGIGHITKGDVQKCLAGDHSECGPAAPAAGMAVKKWNGTNNREWVRFGLKTRKALGCCDCGLVHWVKMRKSGARYYLAFERDDLETTRVRMLKDFSCKREVIR